MDAFAGVEIYPFPYPCCGTPPQFVLIAVRPCFEVALFRHVVIEKGGQSQVFFFGIWQAIQRPKKNTCRFLRSCLPGSLVGRREACQPASGNQTASQTSPARLHVASQRARQAAAWEAAGVFFRYWASHPNTEKKHLPLPAKLFAWLVGGPSGGLPACQRQPDSQPDVVSQAPRGQSAWAGMNPKRGAWMNPQREA